MAWWTTDDYGREYHITLSEFTRDSVSRPDTVTSMPAYPGPYFGAAISTQWRWVLVYDPVVERTRLLTSRGGASWDRQEIEHNAFYGMPMAVIDDSTSLLVVGDSRQPGLQWARICGSRVEWAPQFLTEGIGSNGARFRPRPSGGHWLSWGTYDPYVVVSHYGSSGWAVPETLRAAYLRPEDNPGSYGPDMSRDGYEYPVVAWDAQNQWAEMSICVSIPSDSGFGLGEEIPEAAGGCSPTVAHDPNGDVWLAWKPCDPPDNERFMHTYTRATCDLPVVQALGRARQVRWRLTEAAPGSWWTVLRALNDGPFESQTRVRAGDDLSMSWTDSVVPRGLVRYRIRRDCLDKRYEWTSEEARWPAPGTRPLLLHISEQPVTGVARLLVVDAVAGPLEIEVFDLQGRRVKLQRLAASGTGRDAVEFDLRQQSPRLPAGVYFARAVEVGGRESDAVRLVMLR